MAARHLAGYLPTAVIVALIASGPAPAATLLRIDAFGRKGTALGRLSYPSGIAVAPDGTVFVSDTLNGRLQAFDPGGAPLRVIGSAGRADGQFGAPQGVAVAGDGSLWVADNGRDRIQHFSAVGTLLGAFGSSCLAGPTFQGPCHGGVLGPEGVAIAKDGSVFVADTRNSRVQHLSADGTFRAVSRAGLRLPEDVAVTRDGSVLVADTGNDRLVRLAVDLGSTRATVRLPNGWRQPVGMTVAPGGCAYFLDWNVGRVGVVAGDAFAATAVDRGTLSQPQALAAGPDGSLYVADSRHNRIVRFDDPTPASAGAASLPGGAHKPILSALSISPTLRTSSARGCSAAVASAATITYRVSRQAHVTFTVRRKGRAVGRFAQEAGAGANVKRWAGTIGASHLRPGAYVIVAHAGNRAGSSAVRADSVTIIGGSRAAAARTP